MELQTPDDEQKTCPKHVAFYSKNKFEKLVHLVGFIIRIYHNARSSKCQILPFLCGQLRLLNPSALLDPEVSGNLWRLVFASSKQTWKATISFVISLRLYDCP
jgi:hypothetical protein